MGFSLFYMAHGIDPILPFDLAKATFLVPKLDKLLSRIDLLAIWTCQLEEHESDLNAIKEWVLKAWYTSIAQFEKDNANLIKDSNFMPGLLVLGHNTRIETDLSQKNKTMLLRAPSCCQVPLKQCLYLGRTWWMGVQVTFCWILTYSLLSPITHYHPCYFPHQHQWDPTWCLLFWLAPYPFQPYAWPGMVNI